MQWGSSFPIDRMRTDSIAHTIKRKGTIESIEPMMKRRHRVPFPARHGNQVHGLAFHSKALRSSSYKDTLTGAFWKKTQVG